MGREVTRTTMIELRFIDSRASERPKRRVSAPGASPASGRHQITARQAAAHTTAERPALSGLGVQLRLVGCALRSTK